MKQANVCSFTDILPDELPTLEELDAASPEPCGQCRRYKKQLGEQTRRIERLNHYLDDYRKLYGRALRQRNEAINASLEIA